MAHQKLSRDIGDVGKRRVKDLGCVLPLLFVPSRYQNCDPHFFSSQNKPNTGDFTRISKLDQEIAKANGALEKFKEQSSRIDQDLKVFEKVLDIGSSKLLTQKSKVVGIRLHINLANEEEITKVEVAKVKQKRMRPNWKQPSIPIPRR